MNKEKQGQGMRREGLNKMHRGPEESAERGGEEWMTAKKSVARGREDDRHSTRTLSR
jgi:hypothetical protein